MSQQYARPLSDNLQTTSFLTMVLGYQANKETGTLAVKVAKAEILLTAMASSDTLERTQHRDPMYASDQSRRNLRADIFQELISLHRLVEDDDMRLGMGGARPPVGINVLHDRTAFILIGLPASGKSSIANRVADEYGALVVDSDYAKRKFPEYIEEYGAALLHNESTLLTFGLAKESFANEPNLLGYCVAQGINIVIPKVGARDGTIRSLRDLLRGFGYEVHLTLVKIDRVMATQRALIRFTKTNRYVPIALVFDGYSNDPILNYYYMKEDQEWASVGQVSTEGEVPVLLSAIGSNPAFIYGEV